MSRLRLKAFVQLADENQAGIRGDARSLKRDLQKAVEGELKGLGFFLTHWVMWNLDEDAVEALKSRSSPR
jgi:hypothetical protein